MKTHATILRKSCMIARRDRVAGDDEIEAGKRLAELFDVACVGNPCRVRDVQYFAFPGDDLIRDGGGSLHERKIAFAFKPLLHDLHVQHAQKPAPKSESQPHPTIRVSNASSKVI